MIADIIGQVFWFGILATPIISFFIVRRVEDVSVIGKLILGGLITFCLEAIFLAIAMRILLRDGLGPT